MEDDKQFRTIRKLGSGAYGNVYEVKAPDNYAIKVYDDKFGGLTELAIMLSLPEHPNVITLRKYTADLDQTCLPDSKYEYCPLALFMDLGESDIRKNGDDIDLEQLYLDISAGISHLHANGIVHGDIKPENILRHNGRYKLADFSLSEFICPQEVIPATISTMYYRAPEIVEKTDILPGSDWFSLGVTLLEIMCGNLPFRIKKDEDIASAHDALYQKYPKLATKPRNSADMNMLRLNKVSIPTYILQLLHENPKNRFHMSQYRQVYDNYADKEMAFVSGDRPYTFFRNILDVRKKKFYEQLLEMKLTRRVFWQMIYAINNIKDIDALSLLDFGILNEIYRNIFYQKSIVSAEADVMETLKIMRVGLISRTPYENGYGMKVSREYIIRRITSENFFCTFNQF